MKKSADFFFANLPLHGEGLGKLLSQEGLFTRLPDDWHIVVADIKNSTKAIAEGLQRQVNFIATGSIVTVLNVTARRKLDIPFFFGGDGATFLIPSSMLTPVMEALSKYRANVLTTFKQEIITGTISIASIYQEGLELRIAKHSRSSLFSMPVILGNGLKYAEKSIKAANDQPADEVEKHSIRDLSGMQCRFSTVPPLVNDHEVVALIVIATDELGQSKVFTKVLEHLESIYGPTDQRQPISVVKLRTKRSYQSLRSEILAKKGKFHILDSIRTIARSLFAYCYLKTWKGKQYLEKVVAMADTLVIDGKINTLISGTKSQREQLENYLNKLEQRGEIQYGLQSSQSSMMSCYVRNMNNAHIHFVDGTGGGYTAASRILKNKLKFPVDAMTVAGSTLQ